MKQNDLNQQLQSGQIIQTHQQQLPQTHQQQLPQTHQQQLPQTQQNNFYAIAHQQPQQNNLWGNNQQGQQHQPFIQTQPYQLRPQQVTQPDGLFRNNLQIPQSQQFTPTQQNNFYAIAQQQPQTQQYFLFGNNLQIPQSQPFYQQNNFGGNNQQGQQHQAFYQNQPQFQQDKLFRNHQQSQQIPQPQVDEEKQLREKNNLDQETPNLQNSPINKNEVPKQKQIKRIVNRCSGYSQALKNAFFQFSAEKEVSLGSLAKYFNIPHSSIYKWKCDNKQLPIRVEIFKSAEEQIDLMDQCFSMGIDEDLNEQGYVAIMKNFYLQQKKIKIFDPDDFQKQRRFKLTPEAKVCLEEIISKTNNEQRKDNEGTNRGHYSEDFKQLVQKFAEISKWTYKRIEIATGININTIKSWIYRSKIQLKKRRN